MWFINDLNLKKQARDLGIKIWQTPGFLFIMLGVFITLLMFVTYCISKRYDSPEILIFSEVLVVIMFLIVGNFIINLFEQIARLNKLKSEFISVASHQLRTPLSAIKWQIELMLEKSKKNSLTPKQRKDIESIGELNQRMTRLVNDLLDVARIDQKRLILRREMVDMVSVVKLIVRQFSGVLKAKNVELVFDSKKKLPEVFCDKERIRTVIENLLNNSIKYTLGHGKIEIKLHNKKNKYILFEIRDNGVGIPREQHGRIFDRFFRSDNVVKYQTEGTGLGLYIAKNVIEQMGGKIWFASEEGIGSVFSFTIPYKEK